VNRTEEGPAKGPPREPDPDPVEQLVSLGGARPELPDERARRLRAFFQESLERELRVRARRRAVQWVMSFATAAVAVVLLIRADALWKPTGARNQREPVAELIKVTGSVTRSGQPARAEAEPIRFGEPIRAGDLVRTGATGRAALALTDGSSVRLDHDSSLRIDSDNRLVLDRGAVYVDSHRPQLAAATGIEVRTPVGVVREIGTQFETRLHEGRLRVRVRTGAVVVEDPSGSYSGEASDELLIEPDGRMARRTIPSYDPDWNWVVEVAPALRLEGTDLSGFLDWFAREAGVSVHYSDTATAEQLRGVRIHGPLDFETPFEALPVVLAASDVDYEVRDGVLLIAAGD